MFTFFYIAIDNDIRDFEHRRGNLYGYKRLNQRNITPISYQAPHNYYTLSEGKRLKAFSETLQHSRIKRFLSGHSQSPDVSNDYTNDYTNDYSNFSENIESNYRNDLFASSMQVNSVLHSTTSTLFPLLAARQSGHKTNIDELSDCEVSAVSSESQKPHNDNPVMYEEFRKYIRDLEEKCESYQQKYEINEYKYSIFNETLLEVQTQLNTSENNRRSLQENFEIISAQSNEQVRMLEKTSNDMEMKYEEALSACELYENDIKTISKLSTGISYCDDY